jgi:hypothetical protein
VTPETESPIRVAASVKARFGSQLQSARGTAFLISQARHFSECESPRKRLVTPGRIRAAIVDGQNTVERGHLR